MSRIFKDKKQQIEDEFEEYEAKVPVAPVPTPPPRKVNEVKEQSKQEIVEREINLSLINDKLNYLISLIQELSQEEGE